MKSVISVLLITTVHFVIGLWLAMKSFGQVIAAYDANRELDNIEKIIYLIVEVMFFPIVTIFERTGYEGTTYVSQYFPFFLNSLFWGVIIIFGYNFIFHKE